MMALPGPLFPTQWDKSRVQKSDLEINMDFPTSLYEYNSFRLFSSGNGCGVAIDNQYGKKASKKRNFAGLGPGIGVKYFRAAIEALKFRY